MSTNQVIEIILGSGLLTTMIAVIFRTGRVVQKIDNMDQKVDKLDRRLDKLDQKIDMIGKNVQDLNTRVSRIEGHILGISDPDIKEHKKSKKHRY